MSRSEEQIDKLLRRYVTERMQGYQPRSTEELWARFEARLRRERRERRGRLLRRWSAAAAAFMVLAGSMGYFVFPEQVRALGKKIVTVQTVVQEGPQGLIQMSAREAVPPDQPPPPPPEEGPVPLEEVRARVPFAVMLPSFVPADYELVGHTYTETGRNAGELTTDYFGDGFFLLVRQSNCDHTGADYGRVVDQEVRVTHPTVRGCEGTLVERTVDGWVSLSWTENGIHYRISGRLAPAEVLQMAESMQEVQVR